jgi:hypothetical protein
MMMFVPLQLLDEIILKVNLNYKEMKKAIRVRQSAD